MREKFIIGKVVQPFSSVLFNKVNSAMFVQALICEETSTNNFKFENIWKNINTFHAILIVIQQSREEKTVVAYWKK